MLNLTNTNGQMVSSLQIDADWNESKPLEKGMYAPRMMSFAQEEIDRMNFLIGVNPNVKQNYCAHLPTKRYVNGKRARKPRKQKT